MQPFCGKPCCGSDQDPVAELLSAVGVNRIQGESQHRRHLTATSKQNGLIRIKRTNQQSGGKSLKGITHRSEQADGVDLTVAGEPRQSFADQSLLERHGGVQGTAADQCLHRQSEPGQDREGCGGPAWDTFRQHQRSTKVLSEPPAALQKLFHPFGDHCSAARDALPGTAAWVLKAQMGKVRWNRQTESGNLRIETELLADHPADQGRRDPCRKRWQGPKGRNRGPVQKQFSVGESRGATGCSGAASRRDARLFSGPCGRENQKQIRQWLSGITPDVSEALGSS